MCLGLTLHVPRLAARVILHSNLVYILDRCSDTPRIGLHMRPRIRLALILHTHTFLLGPTHHPTWKHRSSLA